MYKNLKNIMCIAIVMTTVLTVTGCSLIKNPKSQMTAQLIKPEERKFQTYVVKKGSVRYEDGAKAVVTSKNVVNINSNLVAGVMEEVYVNIWAKVKKGDIIAKYNTKSIENKIEIQEMVVKQYESDLNALKSDSNNNQQRIEKAGIALDIEKTKLKQLNEEKNSNIFRSPIDGIVSALTKASRGTVVGINEIVATIMDANSIIVSAVPEDRALTNYYVGMQGQIFYDNKSYKAEVKEVNLNQKVEIRTNKGVMLEFKENIPKELKLGDGVTYKVFGDEHQDVIIIPTTFLKFDEPGKPYVYVYKNEIREKRMVEIGISNANFVEIKSGLEVDETIILK